MDRSTISDMAHGAYLSPGRGGLQVPLIGASTYVRYLDDRWFEQHLPLLERLHTASFGTDTKIRVMSNARDTSDL